MTVKPCLILLAFGVLPVADGRAARIRVADSGALARAAQRAKPGDVILLAPGRYAPNVYLSNIRGAAGRPIVIRAADPSRRPRFQGGATSLQLSDVAHVELRDLVLAGASGNGLNIDDGGTYATPSHHVTLANLLVRDVGPTGNRDGIKLSGVTDFKVSNCVIENWKDSGSGIDMVGCHRGMIQGCRLRNGGGNGIQAKGGTSRIVIRGCRLEDAGSRALQIGGSTGLEFFRPRVQGYEAKDILAEENVVSGSDASVAFVGVDGATVRRSTFYRPRKWALRILQETTVPGFVPCRNGRFIENIVVWRDGEYAGAANIGPSTAPETFRFARNVWYAMGDPARSRPVLPTPETGSMAGVDPLLRNPERGDFRLKPGSPAAGRGASLRTAVLPGWKMGE